MSKPDKGRAGFGQNKIVDQDKIVRRLHEAIDQLRRDATRVEIWAAALGSFAQPVPEYLPDDKFLLGRAGEKAPRTVSAEGFASAPSRPRWKP